MATDEAVHAAPTRRDTLKYGGAVVGGGLLAGCTGDAEPSDTAAGDETAIEASTDDSYSVSMAPVGEVSFESVPERWIAYDGAYADMAVALGQAAGIGHAPRYYTSVYDELPGVSVDRETIEAYPEVRTKEEFYELDSDVHFYDPQILINWFDWNEADVDDITTNVARFIGNLIFRRSDEWYDYQYDTLYKAFEKIAEVFQEEARYEAFASFHDEFITGIQDQLPDAEPPEVFLTFEGTTEPETFSPYRLDDNGTSKKQWNDLGAADALADTAIDQLSTTDRSGYLNQGPIHNLFLTERAAKQLHPDLFGDVTSDAELFDRQRGANIINGDL